MLFSRRSKPAVPTESELIDLVQSVVDLVTDVTSNNGRVVEDWGLKAYTQFWDEFIEIVAGE